MSLIGRRGFCAGGAALASCTAFAAARPASFWQAEFAAIEQASRGVLGAYILDTATGRAVGWRMDERFAMCSSFKFSLAALVLRRIAAGAIDGAARIRYTAADLLPNSPRSERHLADGMTVLEMAEAAQEVSDNCAANLLLRRLGGPAAVTAFWRSLGDPISRLDDYEPQLNRVPLGAAANTTSPRAMAGVLARLLAHGALPPAARDRLLGWMAATDTGRDRIRAGLPAGWQVGDKTGTAAESTTPGACVDLAFVSPPGRAPLVVTGFVRVPPRTEVGAPEAAALAEVGAVAARWASA